MCHCHHHSCSGGGCGCQSNQGCSCSSHQSHCGCQKKSGSHESCSHAQNTSCQCGCKHCGCGDAAKFLELADHAWLELLKEKIKEHMQSNAKHMDELARLIAEANHEHWQKKMEEKQCGGSFEERLKSFFDQIHHSPEQKNTHH